MSTESSFSLVCIATSSLLVDHILRCDLWADRLRCQVGLWVALSLTTFNPLAKMENEESFQEARTRANFFSWLHAIIFSNILALTIRAIQYRYGGSTAPRSSLYGRHFVDLLPSAVWLGMVFSVPEVESHLRNWFFIKGQEEATFVSWAFGIFICSLAVQCGHLWHMRRKAQVAKELRGIPSSHPPFSHGRSKSSLCFSTGLCLESSLLDDSQWYTWNAEDTLHWISMALEQALEDEKDKRIVLELLAPQRITGDVLGYLTTQQLVQTLQVPYGPACRLAMEIEGLLARHPKPRGTTNLAFSSSFGRATGAAEGCNLDSYEDWLTLHDREYNQPYSDKTGPNIGKEQRATSYVQEPEQETPDPLLASNITLEHEARLAEVMKERFGLELPTRKTSSDLEEHKLLSQAKLSESTPPVQDFRTPQYSSSETFTDVRSPAMIPSSPITNYADPSPPTHRGGSQIERSAAVECDDQAIPVGLLDQMPPHIREIAMRRPDLVRQLIDKKRQVSLHPLHGNQDTPTLPVLSENVHEVLEPNDDDSDNETTSLVHRKRKPQYEALDGKNSSWSHY